jgi:Dullard-like phosphatase family protein
VTEEPPAPARNPFRCDSPAEDEERDLPVEEMWDVSVSMGPLSLRALPDVENIAPSLRNALRFLSYNSCPAADWRLKAAMEAGEDGVHPFLPEPRHGTQLTLVLDLDETLMHCQKKGIPDEQPDMCLHFTDSGSTGYVRFRPYAVEMLEVLATWGLCEVVVFTASTQAYADAVLNVLDPMGHLVQHRLYRQHCVQAHGGYFKDLRALGRPMNRTVLVDNSPVSLAMNPSNGIPIKSWISNPSDTQLRDLLGLLHDLVFNQDPVQPTLEERFQLPRFLETLRCTL